MSPTVLISGAGIAGPTLAWWLTRYGFRCTLVERAPAPRQGGYVIDFWGKGYDIAEKMGLAPQLERDGYHVKEVRLLDHEGHRAGGFGVEVFSRLTGGRYVTRPRSALARMVWNAVSSDCETLFDDSVSALDQDETGVEVQFARTPPRRFDLVVGADGLHSAVRRLCFGPERNFETYLGYVVAAFEVEGYRPRDENVYVSCGVPGRQASRFSLRGDRTLILLVFAMPQRPVIAPQDLDGQKAMLRQVFAGLGWEWPTMLAALERTDQLYFDPVSQIRLPAWSQGRVALIGDAAFCPSLLAGQGSALAMIAAYVLAGELHKARADAQAAFAGYESLLRDFIGQKQRAAEKFAGSFAPRTGLGIFLRNKISRLLALPHVAEWVFGNSVTDHLILPDYGD